jgi:hypothetical protein
MLQRCKSAIFTIAILFSTMHIRFKVRVRSRIFTSSYSYAMDSGGGGVPLGLNGRGMKLTIHLQLVLRSREHRSIHALLRSSSWCSA